jgi:urease accessory protein
MNTISLLQGLRFVDSFFPSGGYAFSSGLEAAVQGGLVKNAEDLSMFVTESLSSGLGERDAVAAGLAHQAIVSGILETALKADRELDAMKLGREGRTASRQMGRQVIRLAREQQAGALLLDEYLAAVETESTPGHLPVSLSLTLANAGWSKQDTIAAFLHQTATGYLAAAMKLLPIGQREGQRLLDSWLERIHRISHQAASQHQLRSWSPVHDICGMRHSQLASRLFRS